ncbi:MAG: asparagine synthase (glutamine-hydrolyzing) [Proteobacteria bacterium]|nr:asparagine synthase (glutamine-hydrolyzing) [Pseudomonadota bacterium]
MCGICGIATIDDRAPVSAERVVRMRDTLVHRGPDGAGVHVGASIGLGHRRLSIVDVAHGQQPMYSDDGRFVIVYNGEVFNHPELKAELESSGVRYRTRSDTETVLKVFERYGHRAGERLRGMFAIAIWDTREHELFLLRDRFGVKPLYYVHESDGTLRFASEIKALVVAAGRPQLNLGALPDFLANHAPSADETLFSGVRRLPPGHFLVWKAGRIEIKRYWDLAMGADVEGPSPGSAAEQALVEEYRARFTEAVRMRLMSDVPLGMFLSGGIDSAAITATMSTLVKEPIRTFSVAFAEREANELEYARLVANAFGTVHSEVTVTPEQFFAELPHLIWQEDEPIAHPSSVALYFVSNLAAQHVKVVLTGEGSDETLAGYNRYRITAYNARIGAAYARWVPGFVRGAVRKGIEILPAASALRQKSMRTFLWRGSDLDDLYFDNFAVFGRAAQGQLLDARLRTSLAGVDPYAAYHAALERVQGKPLVAQLLYADIKTYLHELLMKQDQMSMATSIESRVPFLDHPLVEWVAQLPLTLRLRGTTTKWILREAMKGRLPERILNRPKMGFPVPVGIWLRGAWRPLLDEYLLSDRVRARGLFDATALRRLVEEHAAGVNHSERLWALLTFEIWARMFLDGESPSAIRLAA